MQYSICIELALPYRYQPPDKTLVTFDSVSCKRNGQAQIKAITIEEMECTRAAKKNFRTEKLKTNSNRTKRVKQTK